MTATEQLAKLIAPHLFPDAYFLFPDGWDRLSVDAREQATAIAQSILDALPGLGFCKREDAQEEFAKIADACGRGVAVEINGKYHILGIMARGEADAQLCTAKAVAFAIRSATTRKGEG